MFVAPGLAQRDRATLVVGTCMVRPALSNQIFVVNEQRADFGLELGADLYLLLELGKGSKEAALANIW